MGYDGYDSAEGAILRGMWMLNTPCARAGCGFVCIGRFDGEAMKGDSKIFDWPFHGSEDNAYRGSAVKPHTQSVLS